MVTTKVLDPISAMPFHGLTYPSLQSMLWTTDSSVVMAVGAEEDGQPVGLALAVRVEQKGFCRLASLYVHETHRRRGIGTRLLGAIEELVLARGHTRLEARYQTGRPTSEAADRMLRARGWPPAESERLICRCGRNMAHARWLRDFPLPADQQVVSWFDVTPAEIDALRESQKHDPWIPQSLLPWDYSNPAFNSMALRTAEGIAGWVLTQHHDSKTLIYSDSYMHPRLRRQGRILPLYVAAVRRHLEREDLPFAIWVVPFEHPDMVRFVRRWMAPHMDKVEELRACVKELGGVAAAAAVAS